MIKINCLLFGFFWITRMSRFIKLLYCGSFSAIEIIGFKTMSKLEEWADRKILSIHFISGESAVYICGSKPHV